MSTSVSLEEERAWLTKLTGPRARCRGNRRQFGVREHG